MVEACEEGLKPALGRLHKLYLLDVIEQTAGLFITRGLMSPEVALQVSRRLGALGHKRRNHAALP